MSNPLPHLVIENASYQIADTVILEKINLVSAADSCSALVGPNGAGKSTLLKLCHGLLPLSSGSIQWNGRSPAQMGRKIMMIFQQPYLLRRSVRANLDYVLCLHGMHRNERQRRIAAALHLVGLEKFAARDAMSLSGGEQQRLTIARAWLLEPEVILMDEPSAGLDLMSTKVVEDLILRLKQQNIKIIFSSHNLAQVRRLCDEIIFLDYGKCIKQCDANEFFNNPQESEICEFMRLQAFT